MIRWSSRPSWGVTSRWGTPTSTAWSGRAFARARDIVDLAIYVGDKKVITLVGVLDLEQVLVHINRFDVLGHSSSR